MMIKTSITESPPRKEASAESLVQAWKTIGLEVAQKSLKQKTCALVSDWLLNRNVIYSFDPKASANAVFPISYNKYIPLDTLERKLLTHILSQEKWSDVDKGMKEKFIKEFKEVLSHYFSFHSYLKREDLLELISLVTHEKNQHDPIARKLILSSLNALYSERVDWIAKQTLNRLPFGYFLIEQMNWLPKNAPRNIATEDFLQEIQSKTLSSKTWFANYPYSVKLTDLDAEECYKKIRSCLRTILKEKDCESVGNMAFGHSVNVPPRHSSFIAETCLSANEAPPLNGSNSLDSLISQSQVERIFEELDHSLAHFTERNVRHIAVFKEGEEAILERLPVHVAHLLGLSELVVDGKIQVLDDVMGRVGPHLETILVGNMQRFVEGFPPYKLWEEPLQANRDLIISQIDVQNFQAGALFALMTKQADLHYNNGFLYQGNDEKYRFKLYDVGRCMQPEGFFRTSHGSYLGFICFYMMFPQYDLPLTVESIQMIKNWNIEEIEKALIPNDQIQKHSLDFKILIRNMLSGSKANLVKKENFSTMIKECEDQFDHVMKHHIHPQALNSFLLRIKNLQSYVQNCEAEGLAVPTLRACFHRLLPIEMGFYPLYEKVYGMEPLGAPLRFGKKPIEEVIQLGKKENRLTEEEAEEWLQKFKNLAESPEFPLLPWPWTGPKPWHARKKKVHKVPPNSH